MPEVLRLVVRHDAWPAFVDQNARDPTKGASEAEPCLAAHAEPAAQHVPDDVAVADEELAPVAPGAAKESMEGSLGAGSIVADGARIDLAIEARGDRLAEQVQELHISATSHAHDDLRSLPGAKHRARIHRIEAHAAQSLPREQRLAAPERREAAGAVVRVLSVADEIELTTPHVLRHDRAERGSAQDSKMSRARAPSNGAQSHAPSANMRGSSFAGKTRIPSSVTRRRGSRLPMAARK